MKHLQYILTLLIAMTFMSCNDYLDKVPDNRAVLDSPKAIRELLVSAYPDQTYQVFTEAMSDNVSDRGPQANEIAVMSPSNLIGEQAYKWEEIKGDDQDTPTAYWTSCYNAIATCNQALEAIELNGNGHEYDAVKGEALMCRAYAHFMLVNIFAEHYSPFTADIMEGIPYVKESEKVVFKDYKRNTISEVYQNILADFEAGYPLIDDANYTVRAYHFTKIASAAFATRLFQYINKPDSVIKYANITLGSTPENLIRDWNGKYQDYSASTDALSKQYDKADENANLLIVGCVSFIMRSSYNRFAMDFSLLYLLRDQPNVTGGLNSFLFFGASAFNFVYIPKYMEYFKRESINANFGVGYSMIPMITADEVLLNRAEAYVMKNDTINALKDINTYYSKRIKNYNDTTHTVTDSKVVSYSNKDLTEPLPFYLLTDVQESYIKVILDIRRSEFLHEGLRWFDIKRMHLEVYHYLYTGEASPIKLSKFDLRRAVQIPVDALSFGITPNTRINLPIGFTITPLK